MTAASKPTWSSEARGFLAFLRVMGIGLAAAVIYGVAWVFGRRRPRLPNGATRLELHTQESHIGARLVLGCQAAAFADMRVGRDDRAMIFPRVAGAGDAEVETGPGGRIDPVWPAGWSARLLDRRAELISPDGVVVAREGDVIRSLGRGGGGVCLTIGSLVRVEPAR